MGPSDEASQLTEGTVEFVDKDRLMVKADNQTGIFSRPVHQAK